MFRVIAPFSLILVFALGCSAPPSAVVAQTPSAKVLTAPPEITLGGDEGMADCLFYIDQVKTSNNLITLNAQATSGGKKVGYTVQYSTNWKTASQTISDGKLEFHTGQVTLKRSGPESDAFVAALAKYYKQKLPGKMMVESVRFNAVGLQGDPNDLGKRPVSIKMFTESEEESKYGEFFLDIDVASHSIKLNEKDEEYRLLILKALTIPAKVK